MAKVRYRIGNITGWLMLGTAIFIDLLELLLTFLGIGLVVSWLTWAMSWIIFPIWFMSRKASYTQSKKMMRTASAGMLIGLIPGLNALPELTVTIWLNILSTREEDRKKQQSTLSKVRKQTRNRRRFA